MPTKKEKKDSTGLDATLQPKVTHSMPKKITFPLKEADASEQKEKREHETAESTKKKMKMIADEFGARYAQALGVTPSQHNVAMVKRNVPLSSCNVSIVGTPGWYEDAIYVFPKSPRTKANEKMVTQHPFNAQDIFNMAVANKKLYEYKDMMKKKEEDVYVPSEKKASLNLSEFNNVKNVFVYPFNVQSTKDIKKSKLQKKIHKEELARMDDDGVDRPTGIAEILPKEDYVDPDDVATELDEPLKLTLEVVKRQVQLFVGNFPFKKLRVRLHDDQLQLCKELAAHETMYRLIRYTCKLAYWTMLYKKLKVVPPEYLVTERQKGLFILVCKNWDDTIKIFRKKRTASTLIQPVLLLLVRSICSECIRISYKSYCRTDGGQQFLNSFDKMILSLFDPDEFYGLSIFESTAEAIRKTINQRGQRSRRPVAQKFLSTSPMLRTRLGDVTSGKARRILNANHKYPGVNFEVLWRELTLSDFPRKVGIELQNVMKHEGDLPVSLSAISDDEAKDDEDDDENNEEEEKNGGNDGEGKDERKSE